jgi:hypothetical protein
MDTRQKSNETAAPSSPTASMAKERHYTVEEVSKIWNISRDTVRRLFRNEPGVLVLRDRSGHRKRRYTTLRIPQSVLESVHSKYLLY